MQRRQLHQSCVFLVSSAGETENNQVCYKAKHCPHLQKERVENGREWDGRKTQQQDAARKFELVSLEFEHFPPFPPPHFKTCSNGVVLVKPRAVTRGPPTVGPMKLPKAKAAMCHHDVNCDYGDKIYALVTHYTITRSSGGLRIVTNWHAPAVQRPEITECSASPTTLAASLKHKRFLFCKTNIYVMLEVLRTP